MTPKGLLRDKRCVSMVGELANGRFQEILPDAQLQQRPAEGKVSRVILSTGKVSHDLEDYRRTHSVSDVALVRVEQIYPLHEARLREVLHAVAAPDAKVIWCQEESQNMGAWTFLQPRLRNALGREVHYAGRDASSSPATGSLAIHELEQQELIRQAFTL